MVNKLVIKQDINRPYLYNGNESEIILRLEVMANEELRRLARESQQKKKVGTDVCIVLDASGSMGEPLRGEMENTGETQFIDGKLYHLARFVDENGITKQNAAIQAVERLIPLLRPEDTISLVAYDDNPYLIFEGLKGTDEEKIKKGLKETKKYNGNTNISAALRQAKNVLKSLPGDRYKRIVFLTDGHPTVESEEAGILEGEILAGENITVDCLGIGKDYNYDFLQKIAIPSRGITRQIDTPEEAEEIYTALLTTSQNLVATNVELKVQFSPNVRANDYYRGFPENTYLGKIVYDDPATRVKTFKFGDVERDRKQRYFFKLTAPKEVGFEGSKAIARAQLSYYLPGVSAEKQVLNTMIEVQYGEHQTNAKRRNSDVENSFKLVDIARLAAEAEVMMEDKSKKVIVLNHYRQITEKYIELGLAKEAEEYRKLADKFEKDEKISKHELNSRRNNTSTARTDTDAVPDFVPEELHNKTFKNMDKMKRRRKG